MNLPVVSLLLLAAGFAGPGFAQMAQPLGPGAIAVQAEVAPAKTRADRIAGLSATLQIGLILEVMRTEGLDYGTTLETDMFPGKGGTGWADRVGRIYDVTAMQARFDTAFVEALAQASDGALDVMDAFFASERGQRILTLELEARRALLDDAAEEAAKLNFEEMTARNDPRVDLITRFAEANDLIEMNVAGALNANLAFFRGLSNAGAVDGKMTEDQILSTVWAQEIDIRSETESWLYPYLALAYQPLSDEDMDAYLAFSVVAEGRALNAALFAAFDSLFTAISADLGLAAANQMRGEDI